MRMVKIVLLGTMAGLVAMTAAQAADASPKFQKPIKGDRVVSSTPTIAETRPKLQKAFRIGPERPTPLIVAEGVWPGISHEGWNIVKETGGGPACSLRPAYLVSYQAGLGANHGDLFRGMDYDHGA